MKSQLVKIAISALMILLPALAVAPAVLAKGTTPGTVISYAAEMTYTVSGQTGALQTVASCTVAELIDVNTTWQDAAPIQTAPRQSDAVTTFKITNLGNGSEAFALTVDASVATDDFDPSLSSIWLDSDGDSRFDAGKDTRYLPGSNEPVLAADASVVVFVLCNIPADTAMTEGLLGLVQLTATSTTSGVVTTPAAIIAGRGDGGVDAIVGNTGGSSAATGTYQITGVTVKVQKEVFIVSDILGRTPPLPQTGSVLRYTLTVTAQGTGTAQGVVVVDHIPVNTGYRSGSLTLNNTALTDASDADSGDVGVTTAGAVTVALGDLTTADKRIVTFEVTIN